jgi:maltose alpha-D-glucosyltransferase/alpha-amylase
MWNEYAPDPRMRLNLGIRRRLAPLLDDDARKIPLAYSLLLTVPGSPIIYYGDEISMGDDIRLPDRNGVRTSMQWDSGRTGGFTPSRKPRVAMIRSGAYSPGRVNVQLQLSDPGSLWHLLKNMIAVRKGHPALCCGDLTWLDCGAPEVAAFLRTNSVESILLLHNLSADAQTISLPASIDPNAAVDLLPHPNGQTTPSPTVLQPYEYRWLLLSKS